MGWVFQGNPNRFDIDDYLSRYPELIYWRTPRYAADIAVGDRAFIWRAGNNSGAIAIGTVVEVATPASHVNHPNALGDDLWVSEIPDPDESKTGIHIEELRLTAADDMVPRVSVQADALLASTTLMRMPNGTVFKLSADETRAMERLWGVGASLAAASSSTEGDRRLRSHYVRERSTRLRADKLNAFRATHGQLHCEICRQNETERYPKPCGDKLFEVHHLAPLSGASTPIRTTLDDLAVLCANCHRLVHATTAVDGNYKLLSAHFAIRN